MSRRHHGRPHRHAPAAADRPRRVAEVSPAASPGSESNGAAGPATTPRPQRIVQDQGTQPATPPRPLPAATPAANASPPVTPAANASPPVFVPYADARPLPAIGPGPVPGALIAGPDRNGQCTAPQLRRFIKSRPYVPMHELRRRFGIDGGDDDVTPVRLEPGWVYVGLPTREGMLLGELLRAGEIGYELSLDPRSPIVIGVYPMRPIPRG